MEKDGSELLARALQSPYGVEVTAPDVLKCYNRFKYLMTISKDPAVKKLVIKKAPGKANSLWIIRLDGEGLTSKKKSPSGEAAETEESDDES